MAKLTARSMAFDEAGNPFVLVRQGKQLAICALVDDQLSIVRKVPAKFWWFRVVTVDGQRFALLREGSRAKSGSVAACPLDEKGNAKTLPTAVPRYEVWSWQLTATTSTDGVYGACAAGVYRFAGTRGWLDLDEHANARTPGERDSLFFSANEDGVYKRQLVRDGTGDWQLIHPHDFRTYRKTLLYDANRNEVIVSGSGHDGRVPSALHIVDLNGGAKVIALEQRLWCMALHGGKLFGYGNGVVQVQRDGTVVPSLGDGDIASDTCLFSGGGALYFLAGSKIHRLRDELWESIDLTNQSLEVAVPVVASTTPWADRPRDATTRQLLAKALASDLQNVELLQLLADCLLERDDPRGELIALQCIEAPNKEQLKRTRALLREHEKSWLGPLAAVASRGSISFSRGFVSGLAFRNGTEKLLPTLLGRPEWATVVSLDVNQWKAAAVVALTDDDALQRLASVEHLRSTTVLPEMAPRPWRSLSFRWTLNEEAVGALCAVRDSLPRLRHLHVMPTNPFNDLWSSPLVQRLATLEVHNGTDGIAHLFKLWQSELAHLESLIAHPFSGGHGEWGLVLRRDAKGSLALMHEPYWRKNPYGTLAQLLRALPKVDLASITVGPLKPHPDNAPPTDAERAALDEQAQRLGARLTWTESS